VTVTQPVISTHGIQIFLLFGFHLLLLFQFYSFTNLMSCRIIRFDSHVKYLYAILCSVVVLELFSVFRWIIQLLAACKVGSWWVIPSLSHSSRCTVWPDTTAPVM